MERSNLKKTHVKMVNVFDSTKLVIVVGPNYRDQLDYFHYKKVTDNNREFVPVPDSMLTHDESYNRYILGYDIFDGQYGYWRNKNASILSYVMGPNLFVNLKGVKTFKVQRNALDVKSTSTRCKAYNFIMLNDFSFYPIGTFKQFYDTMTTGTTLVIATVEFL